MQRPLTRKASACKDFRLKMNLHNLLNQKFKTRVLLNLTKCRGQNSNLDRSLPNNTTNLDHSNFIYELHVDHLSKCIAQFPRQHPVCTYRIIYTISLSPILCDQQNIAT